MTFKAWKWRVNIPPPKVIAIVAWMKIRAWFYKRVVPRIIQRLPRKFLDMCSVYVFSFILKRLYGGKPKRKVLMKLTVAEALKYWRDQYGIKD